MRYTWKKECEQKVPDPDVVNSELEKVFRHITDEGGDVDFEKCKDEKMTTCQALECIQEIRRAKSFDGKESDEFCHNTPLFEDSWGDIPLDDIFIYDINGIKYCFTREELENYEQGEDGFVKNPYTGGFDLNVRQLLSQRWDDVLEDDEEEEEEELSSDAQLSVGLTSAQDKLTSYQSVSSTVFKQWYSTRDDLLNLIGKLLMIRVSGGNPFRDLISVNSYQSSNISELYAQFGKDVQALSNSSFNNQLLFSNVIKNIAGNPIDDRENWIGLFITLGIDEEDQYDDVQSEEDPYDETLTTDDETLTTDDDDSPDEDYYMGSDNVLRRSNVPYRGTIANREVWEEEQDRTRLDEDDDGALSAWEDEQKERRFAREMDLDEFVDDGQDYDRDEDDRDEDDRLNLVIDPTKTIVTNDNTGRTTYTYFNENDEIVRRRINIGDQLEKIITYDIDGNIDIELIFNASGQPITRINHEINGRTIYRYSDTQNTFVFQSFINDVDPSMDIEEKDDDEEMLDDAEIMGFRLHEDPSLINVRGLDDSGRDTETLYNQDGVIVYRKTYSRIMNGVISEEVYHDGSLAITYTFNLESGLPEYKITHQQDGRLYSRYDPNVDAFMVEGFESN